MLHMVCHVIDLAYVILFVHLCDRMLLSLLSPMDSDWNVEFVLEVLPWS